MQPLLALDGCLDYLYRGPGSERYDGGERVGAHGAMPRVFVTVAFGALAFMLASGNPSGPLSGLNVPSVAGPSDTVLTTYTPPLTLQLLDRPLQPLTGKTLYLNTHGCVLVPPTDHLG